MWQSGLSKLQSQDEQLCVLGLWSQMGSLNKALHIIEILAFICLLCTLFLLSSEFYH